MKITVVGGTGVFGSRLAELLVRDGHEVCIAARSADAVTELARRIGATPLVVDIHADPDAVFTGEPDAVIDAAGPFQAYGLEAYRLAELCIARGVTYIDLADDAGFAAGISALDTMAREAGTTAISGASSVPGLSSSVVAELASDMDEILLIDTAILPGNRAPRGRSVIASIVGQLGTTSKVWRGGRWVDKLCWTDRRRIRLAPDLTRAARYIEVPDIRLFPAHFRARSVMFRAGMELTALDLGMVALTHLRRVWPFTVTPRRAGAIRWLASLLEPFGTDRGGMRVKVIGFRNGKPLERNWRLVAEAGQGPYIPGIAARAILRRERLDPGARPCLAETPLSEIEDALSDLAISITRDELEPGALFRTVLGDRWRLLPPEIQRLHSVFDADTFTGTASVSRGERPVPRLAAALFRFPRAAKAVPVTVTKTRHPSHEIWQRTFGTRSFRSRLSAAGPSHVFERFGPFTFEIDLRAHDGELHFPVRRGWLLGLPLPRALLPVSEAREYLSRGLFHFDVALHAPLKLGLIVRYRGSLRPVPAAPQQDGT